MFIYYCNSEYWWDGNGNTEYGMEMFIYYCNSEYGMVILNMVGWKCLSILVILNMVGWKCLSVILNMVGWNVYLQL